MKTVYVTVIFNLTGKAMVFRHADTLMRAVKVAYKKAKRFPWIIGWTVVPVEANAKGNMNVFDNEIHTKRIGDYPKSEVVVTGPPPMTWREAHDWLNDFDRLRRLNTLFGKSRKIASTAPPDVLGLTDDTDDDFRLHPGCLS